MKSVEELRRQANKARRLAAGISDRHAQAALMAFAIECETKAEAIEALGGASCAKGKRPTD